MPRNGSGVATPAIDFTTEAASPPLEIAKLDEVLDDLADELTNSIAADGQTNPSADLKMNGFKHTNVGAGTALTHYARISELIDQDHIYYVDSGSANTLAITPNPAIAAYEEGQRFVVRAAANNSGATTLNVNGLGAIAVQTPNGVALSSGAILIGGVYEFTYDASTTPDRWELTSMPSAIPDAMLSANVPLLTTDNTFSQTDTGAAQLIQQNLSTGTAATSRVQASNSADTAAMIITSTAYSGAFLSGGPTGESVNIFTNAAISMAFGNSNTARFIFDSSGNFDFKAGTISRNNASAAEVGFAGVVQNSQSDNYTTVLADCGKHIIQTGASKTITIAANASVAAPIGTVLTFICTNATGCSIAITSDTLTLAGTTTTGTRTLAQNGMATAVKTGSTSWIISGAGLS